MANENAVMIADTEYFEAEDADFDELEASLQNQFEEAFVDFGFLKEEREKIGNPDSLGQIVQDEIWKQFSNQIGLDITNETLIQRYDREHPETYDEVGKRVMQDPKYKEANKNMKEQQKAGNLNDGYTGKNLSPNEQANLDHVVSRKEIYENQRRKQAGLNTEELANKVENLTPTNEPLNKGKQDKTIEDFLARLEQRKKDLIEQNERANEKIKNDPSMSEAEKKAKIDKNNKALQNKLDVDPALMREKDKKARAAINKKIAVEATKETAKKAGKDALKVIAVDALFKLLKEIMNGFVRWIKAAKKTFHGLLEEIKKALTSFFKKLKDTFQLGISSAVGTIVSEIFGPIVSTFKKLASFIKQGVASLREAINYLFDKENKDKPMSIKIAQVGKIVMAGLTGGSAILLGEVLEKYLLAVPGMQLTIPLLGTLANVIGLFLGSLIAGIIGAIAINWIDKFIEKKLRAEADKQVFEKGNEVLKIQEIQKGVVEAKMGVTKKKVASEIVERHAALRKYMDIQEKKNTFSQDDTNQRDCHSKNEKTLQEIEDTLANLRSRTCKN